MRITYLLFVISLLQVHASVYSQKKISLELENVTVEKVFDRIEAQTGYKFLYNSAYVNLNRKVSISVNEQGVDRVLTKIFKDTNVEYLILDKQIVLKLTKKKAALVDPPSKDNKLLKPQRQVTGIVTDNSDVPLPGVTVLVKGTQRGVATDFDGAFNINVNNGEVLVFSYLGFLNIEIEVTNENLYTVKMVATSLELEGVELVSTGYQTISKERSTGSFGIVNNNTLDTKINQNIISKIEGETTGILFDNINGPTIRGISTINAVNDPLVVVDGFPVSQDLSSINPNDVESITVLKDAAAASIWGVRAANGVIVIITKKGTKKGKPKIEFSTNYAITPKYDINNLKYASTSSFIDFEKHRADNLWQSFPNGQSGQVFSISKAFETFSFLNNGTLTPQEASGIINNFRGTDKRDEFDRLFMNDESWMQYNFAIGGGGEANSYRASFTYNKNENQGSFIGNDTDEIIANISNNINISPKLTFTGAINYNYNSQRLNGLSMFDLDALDQYQQILDDQGNFVSQPQTIYEPFKESLFADYPYNWDYNLKQELDNKDNTTKTTQVRFQTSLKYDITDYLSLNGLYQYEWGQINATDFFNENTFRVRNEVNRFTFLNDDGDLESPIPRGSFINQGSINEESHTGRLQLNFDKSFNDHRITGVAGYEARKVKSEGNTNFKYGYDPQSLSFATINFTERIRTVFNEQEFITDPSNFSFKEDRFISYYGNLAYTYKEKYTITGSTRLDDANLFGASEEYRNIPLYSVGSKWSIHNEGFFKSDLINRLALRATYGSNGNVDTGTSPFLQATIDRNADTNNLFSFVSNVSNPTLRLEKTFVTNIGLDFGLNNDRINGSIEYYQRKSEDLLADVTVPATFGFNTALLNVGEMENTGIDIGLRALVIKSDNFNYNTGVNFSYNKNEVTKVDVPGQSIFTFLDGQPVQGRPLNSLYAYQYAGLDADGFPQLFDANGNTSNFEGNILDENGDVVEPADLDNPEEALEYIGSLTPEYYGSWVNNFTYKNVSLRVLTTFKAGHVFRNTDVLNYSNIREMGHLHSDFENRWLAAGDENNTNVPRLPDDPFSLINPGYRAYTSGDHQTDDASHIRLREVILSYNFNSKTTKTLGIDAFRIGFQARNLGVIVFNKWDIDPESLFFPMTPTYTLNFTVNF